MNTATGASGLHIANIQRGKRNVILSSAALYLNINYYSFSISFSRETLKNFGEFFQSHKRVKNQNANKVSYFRFEYSCNLQNRGSFKR